MYFPPLQALKCTLLTIHTHTHTHTQVSHSRALPTTYTHTHTNTNRLHVLERAQRWKEAYHYAIFHGHVAKSLAYMVRAGRHTDVLRMVFRQSAMAGQAKCVPVCAELDKCNQPDSAIRLAMYCAFGEYERDVHQDQLMHSRLPYVQWLVEVRTYDCVYIRVCVCVVR